MPPFDHDFVDSLDAILWEGDPEARRYTFVSRRAEEILGYPLQRWTDEPDFFAQLVHPDDRARVLALREAALHSAWRDHDLEYRVVAADGQVLWLHDRMNIVRDEQGRARQLRGVMADVTARRRTEDLLVARMRQQAAVAEFGQHALAGAGLEALMEEVVQRVSLTLGVEFAKVLELLPGGEEMVLRAGVGWAPGLVGQARVSTGPQSQAGYTLRSRAPVIVQDLAAETRFRGTALLYDHGVSSGISVAIPGRNGPFGILGAHTARRQAFTTDDVHFMLAMANVLATAIERERAEEALTRNAAQLRGLAQASLRIGACQDAQDILQILADQARVIAGAHEACAIVFGGHGAVQTRAFSFSSTHSAWRDESNRESLHLLVVRAADWPARLTHAQVEARQDWQALAAVGASLPPLRGWLAAPLAGRSGARLGLVQLSDKYHGEFGEDDESILVQLAQIASVAIENLRLVAQARDAVHVRDVFLSIAAHELKTPLTALLGNTQLLQRRAVREATLSERNLHTLQSIGEQVSRLSKLIDQLLDLSRIETGQLSIESAPFDLVALVRRVVDETRPGLEQHHHMMLEASGEPLTIDGDELRLEQVLRNLLRNAVKYSPDGGTITVRVSRAGPHAVISVSDEGIGIPREAQARLFARFYRAPNAEARQVGGMGVGLYVVKEIVALHGGAIDVTSAEGQGSTFTVSLPLAAITPHVPALPDEDAAGTPVA